LERAGQPIKVGDDNFDLMLNIMVGIKKSLSSLMEITSMMPLTDFQFKAKNKLQNQWIANVQTESLAKIESFKFRDYAPYVF
jgi:hypothetical protein